MSVVPAGGCADPLRTKTLHTRQVHVYQKTIKTLLTKLNTLESNQQASQCTAHPSAPSASPLCTFCPTPLSHSLFVPLMLIRILQDELKKIHFDEEEKVRHCGMAPHALAMASTE